MSAKALPIHPNLEQYKKQAKDLVKEVANASSEALARITTHHPRLRELSALGISIKLSDAQLVIAREHSFKSWAEFARHVRSHEQGNVRIPFDGIEMATNIYAPARPRGIVLFACASGTSRFDPRNRYIADVLNRGNLCTILADLLTEEEEIADIITDELQFNISMLSRRISGITDWILQQPRLSNLPLGYCGSGTAAAAALAAAAERQNIVRAVVSSGGRPDLAGPWLGHVHAPTLLTVGGKDPLAVGFNYSSMAPFPRETVLSFERIDGSGQFFLEDDALQKAAMLARDWFERYLTL